MCTITFNISAFCTHNISVRSVQLSKQHVGLHSKQNSRSPPAYKILCTFTALHTYDISIEKKCVFFEDIFPRTISVPYAKCRSHFTTWPLGRHVTADCMKLKIATPVSRQRVGIPTFLKISQIQMLKW